MKCQFECIISKKETRCEIDLYKFTLPFPRFFYVWCEDFAEVAN